MKNNRLVLLSIVFCLALSLAALPFMTACSQPAPTTAPAPKPTAAPAPTSQPAPAPTAKAAPVELKLVTVFAASSASHKFIPDFVDRVNKKAQGALTIKLVGGPEVIPGGSQPEAAKSGSIDMVHTSWSYLENVFPPAQLFQLTPFTPMDERTNGVLDYASKLFAAQNLYDLGTLTSGRYFYTYLKKSVTTPQELKGLKLYGSASQSPFIAAVGAAFTNMALSEVYTAAERGVINGMVSAYGQYVDQRHYEVMKFVISHELSTSNMPLIMNLDKWKALPKNLQDLLLATVKEVEPEQNKWNIDWTTATIKDLQTKGVTLVDFSAADAKAYVGLQKEARKTVAKKGMDAESYTKLTEMLKLN